MNDAGLMSGAERITDLDRDAQDAVEGHAAGRDDVVEGLALNVLHHDVINVIERSDVMDGDDVRAVKSRSGARLLHKPPLAVRIAKSIRAQHLQHDKAVEAQVTGFVDDTHAAF